MPGRGLKQGRRRGVTDRDGPARPPSQPAGSSGQGTAQAGEPAGRRASRQAGGGTAAPALSHSNAWQHWQQQASLTGQAGCQQPCERSGPGRHTSGAECQAAGNDGAEQGREMTRHRGRCGDLAGSYAANERQHPGELRAAVK